MLTEQKSPRNRWEFLFCCCVFLIGKNSFQVQNLIGILVLVIFPFIPSIVFIQFLLTLSFVIIEIKSTFEGRPFTLNVAHLAAHLGVDLTIESITKSAVKIIEKYDGQLFSEAAKKVILKSNKRNFVDTVFEQLNLMLPKKKRRRRRASDDSDSEETQENESTKKSSGCFHPRVHCALLSLLVDSDFQTSRFFPTRGAHFAATLRSRIRKLLLLRW